MELIRNRTGLTALAAALLMSISMPGHATLAEDKPAASASTKSKPGAKAPAPAAQSDVDFSVSIPQVDAVNSTLTEEELTDILTGNLQAYADQLATLDADSVTFPTISITTNYTTDGETSQATVTLSDLVLHDVSGGVASTISLGSVDMQVDDGEVSFGTISADNFSIAGILGFYGLIERPGQSGMETIYSNFSAEGGTIEADDMRCTIGATTAAEFRARPLRVSFIEMMAMAQALENDPDDIAPARIAEFARMYADIFTAVESSEILFDGLNCDGTDSTGGLIAISLAGMSMSGMSPGIYPAISIDGLTISAGEEGMATLENFTFKPMDLASTIEALSTLPDDVNEAWFDENWRAFMPAMEGFSISGLDMDLPDPDDEDNRIRVGIGLFDLTLGAYRNGIPADIDLVAENLRAELPDSFEDEQLQQLRDMGLTSIDFGFRIAASWDEDRNVIDVEELSLAATDLGSMMIAGTVANAGAGLFDNDPDVALYAALSVALKSLNLSLTDEGISDLVFTIAAAEQNTNPASMRLIAAGLAEGALMAQLAALADAPAIASTVSRFIGGKARTLDIAIEARNDPGLSAQDLMEVEENPATLIEKVEISAEAN